MGIKLIVDVMRNAPETLTAKELYVATVYAENANDGTRMIWSSIEDPEILHRLRVKRARLYQLIDALVSKGVLEMASAGHKHGRAKYRFARFTPRSQDQCLEELDTETRRPENLDTDHDFSVQEPQTLNHDQCLEDLDLSVQEPWTPTPPFPSSFNEPPHNPPPPPSSPSWKVTAEEVEEEFAAKEDPELQDRAEVFIDKLPFNRKPSRSERAELLRLVAIAFAAGWSDEGLRWQCERNLDDVGNRISMWIKDRLNPAKNYIPREPPAPVPQQRVSSEHRGWRQDPNAVYGRPTRPSRESYRNPTDNSGYHEPL